MNTSVDSPGPAPEVARAARELAERGMAILQAVLERSEVDGVVASLDALARGAAGRGDRRRVRAGRRGLMGEPSIAHLAHHPRLMGIARAAIGPTAVPYRATLFEKSGEYNWLIVWHQDTALPLRERRNVPGWGPWSTKAGVLHAHAPAAVLASIVALRVDLDAGDATSGPLLVLPGTHRLGVLSDEAVQRLARRTAPADCLAGRGGVVAMKPLIVHASSKATVPSPRRVIHIEYAPGLELGDGLELAIC